jgi:uncharacterized membrane protein YdjX (TVP38/TMEM64 family)
MASDTAAVQKKKPVLKLLVGALVLGGIAVFLLRGIDTRALIDDGTALIRDAGPTAFFVGFALLPAIGVPSSVFTFTAGPAFAEQLGMPWVVVLSLLAVTVNLVLTYALAQRALRPLLENLMTRLGYKLPRVAAGEMTDLAIVVRVTPGVPFFAQNYLLGLAGVPFRTYLLISCPISWIYAASFVLFGDALLHGKGRMVMLAASLLVVAVVATHWARKHYANKAKPLA